jgi:hypothetical protein
MWPFVSPTAELGGGKRGEREEALSRYSRLHIAEDDQYLRATGSSIPISHTSMSERVPSEWYCEPDRERRMDSRSRAASVHVASGTGPCQDQLPHGDHV